MHWTSLPAAKMRLNWLQSFWVYSAASNGRVRSCDVTAQALSWK